jgi:hypothetical protein
VPESGSPFASLGGSVSIAEAERSYENSRKPLSQLSSGRVNGVNGTNGNTNGIHAAQPKQPVPTLMADEEDDDDDYWARYDATPARTPGVKRSPAPASLKSPQPSFNRTSSAEDTYFAQYDSVQPAMDNHDPDEAEAQGQTQTQIISQPAPIHPPTTNGYPLIAATDTDEQADSASPAHTLDLESLRSRPHENGLAQNDQEQGQDQDQNHLASLLHPRPASSASSNGSQTVAKLEGVADKQEQSEFGVKQHVSRTIRSLFLLSRASGIDRDEFERMVQTELDCLALMGD